MKMFLKILIYITILVALILISIGLFKVIMANMQIQKRIEEVENILDNGGEETNLNTIVDMNDECNTNNAIGLITFKLNKQYKTAVYDSITEEILSKGAGRASRIK